MKKEEILKRMREWKRKVSFIGLRKTWTKEDEEALKQIIALIKKRELTEEWIEKKAKELHRYAETFQTSAEDFQDFIRSLVKKIQGK